MCSRTHRLIKNILNKILVVLVLPLIIISYVASSQVEAITQDELVSLPSIEIEEITNNNIEDLAYAIKDYEGFYANSISKRNNNPGNLRYSLYQTGTRNGFAYFNTYQEGWNGLIHQLTIAADGRSHVYEPKMTLYEFFNVYAPSYENNPNIYADTVIKRLNVSSTAQLKDFLD